MDREETQEFFKNEIALREKCTNRYKRFHSVCSGICVAFAALSLTTGACGLTFTSMILHGISLGCGSVSVGVEFFSRYLKEKAEKHEYLHFHATSKLEIVKKSPENSHLVYKEYLDLRNSYHLKPAT